MKDLTFLIPIIISGNKDKKQYQRMDSLEFVQPEDFELLKEKSVFIARYKASPWQSEGYECEAYSHVFSDDYMDKPDTANAILLTEINERNFSSAGFKLDERFTFYFGQYCNLREELLLKLYNLKQKS